MCWRFQNHANVVRNCVGVNGSLLSNIHLPKQCWQCCVYRQKRELSACQGVKKNTSEHKIYSICQEARSNCIKWRVPSWFLKITVSKASPLSRRSTQRQEVIPGCPVASGLHVKHWQQGFIWMTIVANECAVCSMSAWSGNKSSSATLTRQTECRSGRLMMARS